MTKPRLTDAELAKLVADLRKQGISDCAIAKKLGVLFPRVAAA